MRLDNKLKAVQCQGIFDDDKRDGPMFYIIVYDDGSVWEFDVRENIRICLWSPNDETGELGLLNREHGS